MLLFACVSVAFYFTLNFFLRAMSLATTAAAAERHDALIQAAFFSIVRLISLAGELRRDIALAQARLPVKMGGMGLTSMTQIRPAAVVGTWALCFEPLVRMCPQAAGGLNLGGPTADLSPCLRELVSVHSTLVEAHGAISRRYAGRASGFASYDVHGRGYKRYSPFGLPPANTLIPVSEFVSKSVHLHHAQCRYTSILHHSAWEEDSQPVGWCVGAGCSSLHGGQ
jgi:hypothetical protein